MKPFASILPAPPRFARGLFLAAAAAGCLSRAAADVSVPVQLAPFVTSATRLPESSAIVGTAVDAIADADLLREQIDTLSGALGLSPGASVFAPGRTGANASLFLRGANSNQVLFLVDGIRLNDANTDYGGFLAGASVFDGDTLEVARGPQSTLYGAGAAGGVVSLASARGSGPMAASLSADAGTYGTEDARIALRGAGGKWGYNVSLAESRTDNGRLNNVYENANLALRLDRALGTFVTAGVTLRGMRAHYGDPAESFTDNPYAYEAEDNWLGTLFFDVRLTQFITTHLTIGGQDRDYRTFDPIFGYPAPSSDIRERRGVADWQNTILLTDRNRLVAGLDAETESDRDTGFGNIDRHSTLFALYAEDVWTLADNLFVTGGVRRDDFNTTGAASTGRVTAAWLALDKSFKLRGSYGTAFNEPSFLDLYGQDPSYKGNPALVPEKSRGWDAGIDFYVPQSNWTLSATWFRTEFRNLIADDFSAFPVTTENIGRAVTRGVELSVRTTFAGFLQAKAAYTRLEADDVTSGSALLRRPHYQATADAWHDFGRGLTVGGGATWVGTRADVDAMTYATIFDPSYAVARFYASLQVNRHLALKARVENAFDRQYSPVNGYPALGRREVLGADWKF